MKNSRPQSGIGVDIEAVSRFDNRTLENDAAFLNDVFTKKELDYCFSFSRPAEHLAVRYCAKEAAIKALNNLYSRPLAYNEIEITNAPDGSPSMCVLKDDAAHIQLQVSMAHEKEKAIAFVTAVAGS